MFPPPYIGDKEVRTQKTLSIHPPHDHHHCLGKYHLAGEEEVDLAIEAVLPYGPVRDVMPYLIRRAEENTSVAGQTHRELELIRKEILRRKAVQPE